MEQTSHDCEVSPGAATRRTAGDVRRSGTSFYWAMRFLPEPRRSSMFAIYAFCRAVDDIADGQGSPDGKCRALAAYRIAIEELYGGRMPELAAVRDLSPVIQRHDLRMTDLLAVIDGMETDASASVRIADAAALALYIDRVAGAVGRMSCRVFGLPEAVHAPLSEALGKAFQLTNILRDLREDAQRDRVYLPTDSLMENGLDHLPPDALVDHGDLSGVCRPLADEAAQRFRDADELMRGCPPGAVKPVRMMRAAYGRLFDKVVATGFAPLPARRVRLGGAEKFAIALRHGIG